MRGRSKQYTAHLCGALCADAYRIFANPVTWLLVLLAAACKAVDCYTPPLNGISIEIYGGAMPHPAFYYLQQEEALLGGLMPYAAVCLCVLPAAALYAEERQKNALVARLQRTGAARHAASRAVCAGLGAFILMALADCLAAGMMAFFWRVPPLSAELLQMTVAQALGVAAMHGLEAAFYALLVLAFSVLLPNRFVLAVLPFILRYAFANLFAAKASPLRVLLPYTVFDASAHTEAYLLGIPEGAGLLVALCYVLAVGILCTGLVYLQLSGKRPYLPQSVSDREGQTGADSQTNGAAETATDRQVSGEPGSPGVVFRETGRPAHPARHHAGRIRAVLGIAKYELYMTVTSAKFWVLLVLAVVFFSAFLADIPKFAADYNLKMPPVAMMFYYSDGTYCNLGSLLFIFLISDAPFREGNQVYLTQRCGRRGLCAGQLLSLCAVAVLFAVLQFAVSILLVLPYIGFSGWGQVWGSIAAETPARLGYTINATLSSTLILKFGPYQALGLSLLLLCLLQLLYAMVLYLLNGVGGGRTGTILLGTMSVLWIVLRNLSYIPAVQRLMFYSPQYFMNLELQHLDTLWLKAIEVLAMSAVLAAASLALGRRMGKE